MTQKIFMTKNMEAVFNCPECGNEKKMDVAKFTHVDKEIKLKVTCKCSHVFPIILERRKHVRREVNLSGTLIKGSKKYPIQVIDISRQGLKICMEEIMNLKLGDSKLPDLNLDDKVIIDFILDDAGKSRVSKEVIVKKIDNKYIGVIFLSDVHYDKFGTYLLFHFG